MKLIAFVNGKQIKGTFQTHQEVLQSLGDNLHGTLVIRQDEGRYHAVLPGGNTTPHFSSKAGAINCALAEINASPTKYIEVKEC